MQKRMIGAVLLVLAGCANMTETQQRAVTGTMIGTAGGAAIGAIAGNAALGAGIGAGVGLAGGLIADRVKKNEGASYHRSSRSAPSF